MRRLVRTVIAEAVASKVLQLLRPASANLAAISSLAISAIPTVLSARSIQ
jgi:hypothetical protein